MASSSDNASTPARKTEAERRAPTVASPAAMASSSDNASGSLPLTEIEETENERLLDDRSSGDDVDDNTTDDPHLGGSGNNSKMKLIVARTWKCLRQIYIRVSRVLSLNEKSSATLMAFISNIPVMGIVTLNIYAALPISWHGKRTDQRVTSFLTQTAAIRSMCWRHAMLCKCLGSDIYEAQVEDLV